MSEIAWYRLLPTSDRWGSYGATLFHGEEYGDDGAVLCGPETPPVFMPSGLLWVSGEAFPRLVAAGWDPSEWEKVHIAWRVDLDWRKWPEGEQPLEYPNRSDPMGYTRQRSKWRWIASSESAWRSKPGRRLSVAVKVEGAMERFLETGLLLSTCIKPDGLAAAIGQLGLGWSILVSVKAWEALAGMGETAKWCRVEPVFFDPTAA